MVVICPNCKCPTASLKSKAIKGNSKKNINKGNKGFENRVWCSRCGWLGGKF